MSSENHYTNIVYINPSIDISDKYSVRTTKNIKTQELLLVEHVFAGPKETCFAIVRDNEYLFNNLQPYDIKWSEYDLMNKREMMEDHTMKKFIKNCGDYHDNIIFGEISSKLNHSCSPNTLSLIHIRRCRYLTVYYCFVYSIKNIPQGNILTSIPFTDDICNCGKSSEERNKIFETINNLCDFVKNRESNSIRKIIMDYEQSTEGKTIMKFQYLANNGYRYSYNDLTLCSSKFINAVNEKFNVGSFEINKEKYLNYVNFVFDILIGNTTQFYDSLSILDPIDCGSKIVCLMASHLNCNDRVDNFNDLLDTINFQLGCSNKKICISLSHDENINITKTLELIRKYRFDLNYSKKKLSQFEHYKKLVDGLTVNDPLNTWIIFSDDDDIWNDNRIYTYHDIIKKVNDDNVAYLKTSAFEVVNNKIFRINTKTNYVDFCVRYKYLKNFFDNVTNEALKHKFCDVLFAYYVQRLGIGSLKHIEAEFDKPMYVWRHVDYDRNCSVNSYSEPNFDPYKIADNLQSYKTKMISNLFDLFMAFLGGAKGTVDDFIKCFETYCSKHLKIDAKIIEQCAKIYTKNYDNHVFRIDLPTC